MGRFAYEQIFPSLPLLQAKQEMHIIQLQHCNEYNVGNYLDIQAQLLAASLDNVGKLIHAELFSKLVEDSELPSFGWVVNCDLNASHLPQEVMQCSNTLARTRKNIHDRFLLCLMISSGKMLKSKMLESAESWLEKTALRCHT